MDIWSALEAAVAQDGKRVSLGELVLAPVPPGIEHLGRIVDLEYTPGEGWSEKPNGGDSL